MSLTKNEARVLEIIKEDPFISQLKLASRLDLTRSTVASVISSLTQKHYLLGRAYMVNESNQIICIGGMNIDRKFVLDGPLVAKTSNPASCHVSVGGVGRNVAENLGRLQVNVSMLSMAGDDQDYQIIKEASQPYVDMNLVHLDPNYRTGTYNAVLDNTGEMQVAMADMEVCDHLTLDWLHQYQALIQGAKHLILDLNPPKETISQVIEWAQARDIPLHIVPVSSPKMTHLPDDLQGVHWMIVNQDESEAYFNRQVESKEDLIDLAQAWIDRGVRQVAITRGKEATYYLSHTGEEAWLEPPHLDHIQDVTGAGDAYAAGIIYGSIQDLPEIESIRLGMANAYHTIQSDQTVRPNLSPSRIMDESQSLFSSNHSNH